MNAEALTPAPEGVNIPIWRTVVLAVLATAALAFCFYATPAPEQSEVSINMHLPDSVGNYWGTDQEVSESELAILPKDTEFAKKLYSDGRGSDINCQIVLAGAEKRSIHRPEICLPGQGWTMKSGRVMPVKLPDGKTLEVMKLIIGRTIVLGNGDRKELTSVFCYWFVGKDTTTPHHLVRILKTNLDMLLHNVNHRWAYVVVSAPALAGFTQGGKTEAETEALIKDFIANLAPELAPKPAAH